MIVCDVCGRRLDPNGRGVYQQVIGWVQVGRKAGGVNAVRYPSPVGRFAHRVCVDEVQVTRPVEQGSLL